MHPEDAGDLTWDRTGTPPTLMAWLGKGEEAPPEPVRNETAVNACVRSLESHGDGWQGPGRQGSRGSGVPVGVPLQRFSQSARPAEGIRVFLS